MPPDASASGWWRGAPAPGGVLAVAQPTAAQLAQLGAIEAERPDVRAVALTPTDPAALAAIPPLTRLTVRLRRASAPAIAGAAALGDALESVAACNTKIDGRWIELDDDALAPLAQCAGLRAIDLSGCPISDRGLAALAPHAGLERAELDQTRVAGPGLAHLAPGLRSLSLTRIRSPLDAAAVAPLAGLQALESLALDNRRIAPGALAALGGPMGCGGLRALSLRYADLPDAAISELAGLEHLESLILCLTHSARNRIPPRAAAAALAGLTSLVRLDLLETRLRDDALQIVARAPGLRELRCVGGAIGDPGVAALAGHASLQVLALSGKKITDAALPALAQIPGLRSLHLPRTSVTPDGIARWLAGTNLREIGLSWNRRGDAWVDALAAMPELERIQIARAGVSKAGLAALRGALPGAQIASHPGASGWTALVRSPNGGWRCVER